MGRAFYTDLPPHLRFVLVALCDHANDDGTGVFVGQRHLARKVGGGERTVRGNLAELRARGYIERIGQRSRTGTDTYRIATTKLPTSDAIDALKAVWRAADVAGRSTTRLAAGDRSDRQPVAARDRQPVAAEPSVEPSVEPSGKELAPAAPARPVDGVYETLFELETGQTYDPERRKALTKTAAKALATASAEIAATQISPEDLRAAIGAWPAVMGDATCTAFAVAKHLPRLRAAANGLIARRGRADIERAEYQAEMQRLRAERNEFGGIR
jgi:hypothetical protein